MAHAKIQAHLCGFGAKEFNNNIDCLGSTYELEQQLRRVLPSNDFSDL